MEEMEAAKIPSGMRIMTEQEKAETLDILAENKHTVIEQIKHLPLVIETPSMIKHQSSLNKKLKEIEATITMFQKPTVFVAMDWMIKRAWFEIVICLIYLIKIWKRTW